MGDFQIRSDSVNVEEIMRQIRARIHEKRDVDYSEREIQELANVKLETFLDPKGVRSDLLDEFRRRRSEVSPRLSYTFEEQTLFTSHRPILRWIRTLLRPVLKLFFNPNPLVQALHIQGQLNTRDAHREETAALYYEVLHNLVVEITRLGIEVKNLKMRVESISSRIDFGERRARALEDVVQYKPGALEVGAEPPAASAGRAPGAEPTEGQRRRRRRRRRRGPARDASIGATGNVATAVGDAGASGGGDTARQPDATSGADATNAGGGARLNAIGGRPGDSAPSDS